MNKIGIHYGAFVNNWSENQFPLIKKVKDLGFDLLEFGAPFLASLSDEKVLEFKEEAKKNNITLACSLGLSQQQDISCNNKSYQDNGLKLLCDTARAMKIAGISDCSGIIYAAWNGDKLNSVNEKPERWKRSVKVMQEAAQIFEDCNVYFNLEVVNRFESFMINTCEEAQMYIDDVDSDHLGIHLDTFHMNIEEDSMIEAIHSAKNRLRYFHIGENNRRFPGTGTMPWKIIFDSLKAANYNGPIAMEPFLRAKGEVASAVSLYRELFTSDNYDNEIIKSLEFVKTLLR